MNQHASESRISFHRLSFFRGTFLAIVLLCAPALYAQLTLSQTYSVPHSIDGESLPVFFDLSSQLTHSDAGISHTQLSISFSKRPDLSDDPAFYSDLGFVLRKLDTTFSVMTEVTLLNVGGFNDGTASSFFDGMITFDDDGATVVNSDPDQPTTGLFRAVEPLSLFNGVYSPFWELRLVDAVSENPLLFHSATLTTTVFAAVPEPSSLGLAGASLLGLVALWRRKSSLV